MMMMMMLLLLLLLLFVINESLLFLSRLLLCLLSSEFRATEGMQTILRRYSEKLNVLMSVEVTGIDWRPRDCRVTVTRRGGGKDIGGGGRGGKQQPTDFDSTTTTSTFFAERVLVTIPIGALQATLTSRALTFAPSLPQEKLNAINDFTMRAATKVRSYLLMYFMCLLFVCLFGLTLCKTNY
jgi:hypothetical protein